MKRPTYIRNIISSFGFGIIFLILVMYSCSNSMSCDGKRCKAGLGFNEKETVSDRDSLFFSNNPVMASKFKVFVESSCSMDGYVAPSNTDFKSTLHRLIGHIEADVLENDTNITLNYINSKVFKINASPKQFTNNLSPSSFSSVSGRTAGGDRENSDIIDVLSQVVKNTGEGEVSMFVSDCVYSPEASEDIDKALQKQETDMMNILKKKTKKDSKFGLLLFRLISDFDGIYYTKTNAHVPCKGEMPYFIWFFGDESILGNLFESVSKIMTEKKAEYIVGIPGYNYLPYKTIKSDHAYHFLREKADRHGIKKISFIADMGNLPLSKDYILKKENYSLGSDKYFIDKIEEYSDPKGSPYNYKFTLGIKGRKNEFLTPTRVKISLRSMLSSIPEWVDKYNDPLGIDYERGYNASKLRTFGLSSLVDGIAGFYKNPDYVTFKIQIN